MNGSFAGRGHYRIGFSWVFSRPFQLSFVARLKAWPSFPPGSLTTKRNFGMSRSSVTSTKDDSTRSWKKWTQRTKPEKPARSQVKHLALPRFWRRYCGLPKHAQKLADQKFELLEANPLGLHYRASERETRGHGLVLDRTHTRNMTGCLHE